MSKCTESRDFIILKPYICILIVISQQNDAQEQLIGALTGAYHVGKHFGWWNAQKQDNDETELKGLEANLNDVESMQEEADNNYEGEIQVRFQIRIIMFPQTHTCSTT